MNSDQTDTTNIKRPDDSISSGYHPFVMFCENSIKIEKDHLKLLMGYQRLSLSPHVDLALINGIKVVIKFGESMGIETDSTTFICIYLNVKKFDLSALDSKHYENREVYSVVINDDNFICWNNYKNSLPIIRKARDVCLHEVALCHVTSVNYNNRRSIMTNPSTKSGPTAS